VDFSILQATASAQLGTVYIGADAAVNLVGGQVSVFDANLGFGVGTGIGIRDEAIEVKVVGCGITVGKRIGISVFGNKIEINFGRFFDLFQCALVIFILSVYVRSLKTQSQLIASCACRLGPLKPKLHQKEFHKKKIDPSFAFYFCSLKTVTSKIPKTFRTFEFMSVAYPTYSCA
jgi:hypothetical protein